MANAPAMEFGVHGECASDVGVRLLAESSRARSPTYISGKRVDHITSAELSGRQSQRTAASHNGSPTAPPPPRSLSDGVSARNAALGPSFWRGGGACAPCTIHILPIPLSKMLHVTVSYY